tara:strand:+ start:61 stop:870 length:810 start_codon:yes stop_codon:yes gene_type:complete
MPSKRIPKKKLACATKETKEGKQYTTCYEKKVTPARTFRVKKKVPVPEKKTSVKKPAAKSNGADIISQLRKKYPDQDFKLESRFGEKKYIVMGTLGRKVSAIVSDNLKEIGVVGKTSIADIMNKAASRNTLYPAPEKKTSVKKPAAKKPAAKSVVSMATPPIVTANEAGAKKLLKFMTKVSKEKEQRAGITSPALGWEYHSFQFKKLTGGDLEFIESGKRHELPLKKIMSFLRKVKSGTYPYPNKSPPDFYRKYLHLLDFNSMVKVSDI